MKKLFLMALVALMSLQSFAQISFGNEVNSKNHFEYWTNRRYLRLVGHVSHLNEAGAPNPYEGDTIWSIVATSTTNQFDSSPIIYLGNDLQSALSAVASIHMWSQNAEWNSSVTITDFLNQNHILTVKRVLGVRTVYVDSPKTAGLWTLTPECFNGTEDKIKELITTRNF